MNLVTPTLLITDDDRNFRETLHEAFVPRGFRTLLAEDGEQALGILQSETVHLLLLDMHMPKLSGIDTIHQVRRRHGQLPWILMSARLDDDLRNQAEEAEAFSILPKPFRLLDLTSTVGRALQAAYGWEEN